MPPTPRASLTSLPPEILLLVCALLSTNDLYALAFASSYLHRIALPAYLTRYGCGYGGEVIISSILAPEVVRVLRLALFRPTISKLVYRARSYVGGSAMTDDFDEEPNNADASGRCGNLPALHALLQLGLAVEEVHVHLGDVEPLETKPMDVVKRLRSEDIGISDNYRLAKVYAIRSVDSGRTWISILDAFLDEAQCQSLTVEAGWSGWSPSLSESIDDALLRRRNQLASVENACLSASKTLVDSTKKLFGLGAPRRLNAFQAHTTALFHPPLLPWTLATLKMPSLTVVSFDCLETLPSQTWSLLLSCISIPNLQDLAFNMCAIQTADLHTFLRRHPSIQTLKLGRIPCKLDPSMLLPPDPQPNSILNGIQTRFSSTAPSKSACAENHFLPLLHTLSAFPDYIVAFLSSPTAHPFPNLRSVVVRYRDKEATASTFQALNHELAPVCLRLQKIPEIILSLSFNAADPGWSTAPKSARTADTLGPAATKDLEVAAPGRLSIPLDPLVEDHRSPPGAMTFVTSCVTKVDLDMKVYMLPLSVVFSLPKWLGGFPKLAKFSLQTLALNSRSTGGPKMDPENSFMGRRLNKSQTMNIDTATWQMDHYTSVFLHSMVTNCPALRALEVDGKAFDLPAPRPKIQRLR